MANAGGPISFARFMAVALHDPEVGYYGRVPKIGRSGDFFTSVSVGPLFGRLLAVQLRQIWDLCGRPRPFVIFEQGAHDGQLAEDILETLAAEKGNQWEQFCSATLYRLVEPSPAARELQARRLGRFGCQVEWQPSPETRPAECGVFLTNELVDSLPVHRIVRRGGAWREQWVGPGLAEGCFEFVDGPEVAGGLLEEAVNELPLPKLEGYAAEIHLAAREWMGSAARAITRRGAWLTIDYGGSAGECYHPSRPSGTLRGFRNHRQIADPLAHPGDQDITVDVDFTSLARAGERAGLKTAGLVSQHHFLVGLCADALAEDRFPVSPGPCGSLRPFATLMHPGHLGSRFKVLIQTRGLPHPALDGLRYAREESWL